MFLKFTFTVCILLIFFPVIFESATAQTGIKKIKKEIELDGSKRFQTIEGFGVNINPMQWRDGNLKPAFDKLVNDLGGTLMRFDCYGMADWLDPAKQNSDGSFPDAYLKQVYTSKPFKDAWACFRYLNSLGIEPVFNVSGPVPAAWTTVNPVPHAWTVLPGSVHDRLNNYNGYATMVVSMLVWARKEEKLKFSYLMPFNETDLGFPEGPRLLDEDCVAAFDAIIKKLDENNMSDIKCIVMDDSGVSPERVKFLATHLNHRDRIKGFGLHTYGNGADEDHMGSHDGASKDNRYAQARSIMDENGLKEKSLLLTEYGDLDQSEEIEFEVGWRSTRRLLKCLNAGMSGGIAWDAFDNYHKHDSTFALYGFLKTDTNLWKYTPKSRYFAAKQVYKWVRPGFRRVEILTPADNPNYIYNEWKYTLRNMLLSAFCSPDQENFTLTGMSNAEAPIELKITLKNLSSLNNKTVNFYITTATDNCRKIQSAKIEKGAVTLLVPPRSIFTVTTLN